MEHITILATIRADGVACSPLLIFSGKSVPDDLNLNGVEVTANEEGLLF
jgi:hypothetical protein